MGFDINWARKRSKKMNDNFNRDIFERAAKNFVLADELKNLKPVDWDVVVRSQEMNLVAAIDELVTTTEQQQQIPLFVSLKAPAHGVWYRDMMKAAVLALIDNFNSSLFYYAYSGEIRKVDVGSGLRRRAMKLIERVKMISKGFVSQKIESRYCKFCNFREDCLNLPNTFASKFL
jgi:CRISPR/Cas system-associated exonuclease Cas4 (RecB family)